MKALETGVSRWTSCTYLDKSTEGICRDEEIAMVKIGLE